MGPRLHPSSLFSSSWDWRLVMNIRAQSWPSAFALFCWSTCLLQTLWPAACLESLLYVPMAPHTFPVHPLATLCWNCFLSGTLVLQPEECPDPFFKNWGKGQSDQALARHSKGGGRVPQHCMKELFLLAPSPLKMLAKIIFFIISVYQQT